MKSFKSIRLFSALLVGLFGASFASAADTFDLAKAKATYPLTTCVVSGESLAGGDMGPPVDYVYKQDGQPDRLVRFCCKMCIGKFKKDPAKYLKQIDAAAPATTGKGTGGACCDSGCSMDMK